MKRYFYIFFYVTFVFSTGLKAQDSLHAAKATKTSMLRDTLDNKTDVSHYLIDAKGFLPIPYIVTEPALGGFGLVVAPVFITPRKVEGVKGYIPPDITGGAAMYTVNGSWLVGAFRFGSFPKAKLKYRIGAFYASLNLSFYRNLPSVGEKSFDFNIKAAPIFFSLSRQIIKNGIYLGLKYNYSHTIVTPRFADSLPDFVTKKELHNTTAPVGIFLDWDRRNTIFTPDKGFVINLAYSMNASWTGSDFTYSEPGVTINWFIPIKNNWISGFRVESEHVFNTPPFYLEPAINLRGIPATRYQGVTTMVLETEQRYDLNFRWSVVGFGGLGKAIERDENFGQGQTVYNYGGGFRYLLARVFKLRAGIDIAKGPDSFGWYIVFGHNWNR